MEVNSCKNINNETWGSHKALAKVIWDITLYFYSIIKNQ